MHHLVGAAEIAELLGISRQRVHQLATRDDFPKPIVRLSIGRVWERDEILAWMRRTGRGDDRP